MRSSAPFRGGRLFFFFFSPVSSHHGSLKNASHSFSLPASKPAFRAVDVRGFASFFRGGPLPFPFPPAPSPDWGVFFFFFSGVRPEKTPTHFSSFFFFRREKEGLAGSFLFPLRIARHGRARSFGARFPPFPLKGKRRVHQVAPSPLLFNTPFLTARARAKLFFPHPWARRPNLPLFSSALLFPSPFFRLVLIDGSEGFPFSSSDPGRAGAGPTKGNFSFRTYLFCFFLRFSNFFLR